MRLNITLAALAATMFLVIGATTADAATSGHNCRVGVGWSEYGWAFASNSTTCPFAARVVRQADRNVWRYGPGAFRISAWSPVTHRWYLMSCNATRGYHVSCVGGIGSRVSWWM
jgi:hypothetical protein